MSTPKPKRPASTRKRMIWMLIGALVVFGGVFGVKAMMSAGMNTFFDNMPQPAVAVSSYVAKTQRWSDGAEAVGSFVAINGTDVTTEAGGVVRAIEFEAGQPVQAGDVLLRLNTANEEATLRSLPRSKLTCAKLPGRSAALGFWNVAWAMKLRVLVSTCGSIAVIRPSKTCPGIASTVARTGVPSITLPICCSGRVKSR